MKRVMIFAIALLVMVAGMAVSQEANAGLFSRKSSCCKPQKCKKARRANKCCEPTCCEPAPCCAPKPTCCEAPAPCCAAPAPCGCIEATPACGCQAAAPVSCGCETNCNCLSKRKLRRANRKGECCGAVADTCNTCSAPVQTCGYSAPIVEGCSSCAAAAPVVEGCSSCAGAAPVVEGCSSCGGGASVIEGGIIETSSPTPAGEEAAPEAPQSDSTT